MTATAVDTLHFQRPPLYAKQRAAIYCPERYAVIEASTKSGKTLGCLIWLFEQALRGKRGQVFWWVTITYQMAKRLAFDRLLRMVRPVGALIHNDSELWVETPMGTRIYFKGADRPDTLYGEDVQAVVVDEASRCKSEAWYAIRSTLTATRGHARIIGNVKGRKNWAFKLARQAEDGAPDMRFSRLTAHDAVAGGILTAAEVADAKEKLPEAWFNELYLGIPSDDQGNPFGIPQIHACVRPTLSSNPPVMWGWDLARGIAVREGDISGERDWTVGIGLDAAGQECRFARWQRPWDQTFEDILRLTGGVTAYVDSTGSGDTLLAFLQKGRPNYHRYDFTRPSKQHLMEGLARAIHAQQVGFHTPLLVNELESFEYEPTETGIRYQAIEGVHDDCVCALALALHGLVADLQPAISPAGLARKSLWMRP